MAEELYVLHEHASGYSLFRVKEFEELAGLDAAQHIQENVTDLSRFNSLVKLIAYAPFRTNANALENVNCISEGVCHDDLRAFLEVNFPNSGKTGAAQREEGSKKKHAKSILGVTDSRLASHISETLGISVRTVGVIPEVARGIRLHFPKLVRGLTEQFETTSQRALAHSYSRMKVKFNVNRIDNMIIQAISLLDQLDKDINTFAMRIREWYSYHFPELVRIVPDNAVYCRVANVIGDRRVFLAELDGEPIEGPESKHAIVQAALDGDEGRYGAVIDAARSSIGLDIAPVDLINIELFTTRVSKLIEFRKQLHTYLVSKMSACAPNLSALIGEQVGARLIAHAGSLTNLAKYPASTVQILGAEKALFRALKTRSNTPKYGLIYHSTFIGRARAALKGRVSRLLANKCSIASRIDCFSDTPTESFGSALREQLESRLRFFEAQATGLTVTKPPRNDEIMKSACEEAERVRTAFLKAKRKADKKESKAKKRKLDDTDANGEADVPHTPNGKENGSPQKSAEKLSKKERRKLKKQAEAAAEEPMVLDADDSGVAKAEKKKRKKQLDATA